MKIKILRFNKVKSTNDIAIKYIKKKITKPTLITAQKQTNGRGRFGKKWVSKKGNLFFSIFFEINKKKMNFKKFATLNAFLLKNVVSKFTIRRIKIKWPNDLLINKDKFCGILQETINYDRKDFLIVGIGINTNISPKIKGFNSTSLKTLNGKKIDNVKLLSEIKSNYEKLLFDLKKYNYFTIKRKYKR